jgi:hypothetical protein
MHGAKDPSKISPDTYTFDQTLLDRPGNNAIQLNLLHNYQSNPPKYEGWHEFFRNSQPPSLTMPKPVIEIVLEAAQSTLKN